MLFRSGLEFTLDEEKFSDDDCIVEWLAELAAQLEDLYIVDFDGASEDYHFTIMNKGDCEKAMDLFSKMTAHIDGYNFKTFIITDDFQGHMEKFKRTLEIQKELGAPFLRMFSFYLPEVKSPADCKEEVFSRVGALAEEAGRWDAVLLHENEKEI